MPACAFIQVHAASEAVAAAEQHLQALLPRLAKAAGVPSLSYVTIQNQGSFLVELPAGRTNVPAGWQKVRGAVLGQLAEARVCMQHACIWQEDLCLCQHAPAAALMAACAPRFV